MTKTNQRNKATPGQGPVAFLAGGGEMGKLVAEKDWSKTPLGPIESWPQSLRTAVSLCLSSTFPMNIIWGPESIQIYNDGYRVVCGDVHPRALGEDYRVTWASAWPAIGESFERAWAGQRMFTENQRMFLKRLGGKNLEETFFTFSHSPIQDESGRVGGLFHPVTETTANMLAERRTRALRDLASNLAGAIDEADVARRTVETLARFEFDLPFVLYYVFDLEAAHYTLTAHHGITPGLSSTPLRMTPEDLAPWPMAEALASSGIVEVSDLPSSVLRGVRCGPYEEPPDRGFIIPIVVPAAEQAPAVIVTSASPRLPLSADYRSFYDLLGVTIAGALAAVRAREDARRRAEALAELDRAKTAFFSNVSHEFRTPLTLMLGPLEDALANAHGDLPPGAAKDLEVAHRNSLRLLRLVNTLLDFSRIEARRVEASYEPIDLAAFTAELASVFRSAVEKAGLRLVVDCPPLPEPVYVDREMWEKIVLNLLSNAFKFTFEGEIKVALRWRGERVELLVADTGVGIPLKDLPRVFERFHRVKDARARSHEGSGIGLAFVQELVRLHGGDVSVQSQEGCGSTFTVTIQTGLAHLPADRINASRRLESTSVGATPFVEEALRWLPDREHGSTGVEAAAAFPSPTPVRSARILLADDNADMREYVCRLLAGIYEVEVVGDGEAAWERIQAQPPDLVVTDVMMPRLDGFGLIHKIRADERAQTIPVILLSARAGEESRVEGLATGADDYLVKPFSARELVARVETHVKLARFRRETQETLRQSEELFRAFTRATFDVVYRMNADWSEMRHLHGREFIADTVEPSRTWLEKYIHPDDQQQVMKTIHRAIQCRSVFELEHRVIRVDGSLGWTHSRAIPIVDGGGEIVEWFGAASDVTLRKQAEEALRTSEEKARQARDYAQATLRTSPVPLLVLEKDLRVHTANEAFYATFQVEPSATEGRLVYELGNGQWDIPRLRELLEGILAKHSVFKNFEVTHEFETIGLRTMLLNARRMESLSHAPERIVLVIDDITERKRAEEALRQSEERFRAMADNIAQLAWICDAFGNVTWYNKRWLDYTGMSFQDMKGWDWKKVQHPDHVERVVARVRRSAETGEVWEDTFPLRGKDNQYRWFLSRAVPIRDERGNIVRWFGTNTDVTEQRAAQEALRQAHELLGDRSKQMEVLVQERTAKLQDAITELEAFSYSVAHDLRAPLRAMSAYASILLQESAVSAQGRGYLQRIHRAAQRLDRLTQEVLSYSRLARAEIVLQPIDLDKLVREIIDQYPQLSPVGARDKIELRSPLLPVLGHEGFLTQALSNLLVNACKFVAPGVPAHVCVWTEEIVSSAGEKIANQKPAAFPSPLLSSANGSLVRICVQDNGIGVAPEHRDRLFKLFGRVHPEHKYEGTGVGLAIVKKAAERMGGTVGFESEPGKGSRFWVQLKRA